MAEEEVTSPADEPSLIDHITGRAYADEAEKKQRSLPCPWSSLADAEGESRDDLPRKCGHVFGRIYDLQRHLKAAHGIETEMCILEDLMVAWS